MARHIVIVGGGAAGTLTALHVARAARRPIQITVVEPREQLGEGVAYGTQDEAHLLNVPAIGMSAIEQLPHHFANWAKVATDAFVPRRRYAEYLRDSLAVATAHQHAAVRHLRSTITEIGIAPCRLTVGDGTSLDADAVVLALGNAAPSQPEWTRNFTIAPVIADPWAAGAIDSVANESRVLCVGTGLTFVDVALSLTRRDVHVTGISRHGLLPTVHGPVGEAPTLPDTFSSPLDLMQWIRSQPDWRAAFAALRPATQRIWRNFTPQEQQRFLRHARRYWDVHRHRMSRDVASALDTQRHAGRIKIERGDARALAESGAFDAIILCTGPDDSALLNDVPLAQLVANGIVAAGPHAMGIATDPDTGQVCDRKHQLVDGLFAIGPLRRGTLWESTAIPEIRSEAQRLAALLLA